MNTNTTHILETPEQSTVQEWQAFFKSIYGERNIERFSGQYGLSRMWLQLVQDMATLANGIRKNDVSLILRMLPRLFCWLCGFCTSVGVELEDIVWHFFPGVCPTCWSPTCGCGANKIMNARASQKDEQTLRECAKLHSASRPRTLDDFVAMFAHIYGNHSESANLTDSYLHFSEEVGEVAEWIRVVESTEMSEPRAQRELTSELADVFSWMCKLCWRTNLNLQGFGPWAEEQYRGRIDRSKFTIHFSGITAFHYNRGCPGCEQAMCDPRCPGWERQIKKAGRS